MLTLPNFTENCSEVQVLKLVRDLDQDTFFITVEFVKIGDINVTDLKTFLLHQVESKANYQAFKVKYQKKGTQLRFTFFSKNQPLDRKYSLINVFVKLCQGS